ncbi:MAG: type II toxin-antitoxin system RelE/ParE family toxin [Pirellulales bacterium]|nr:type II toxin-antitoxin system RelE/ParE family toxin [Pirellulales bacterium]
MKIVILPQAEHDLEIGADFYESQRERLGKYFTDCLLTDIDSLLIYAGVHERVQGLYRCNSKRFPFAIYYDIRENEIEIYAVLDCRQDPDKISAKLKGLK